jgi:hypothetical protein
MNYFPERKYIQVIVTNIKHIQCKINWGGGVGILIHTVGAQWYMEQFNVMLYPHSVGCRTLQEHFTNEWESPKHKLPPWLLGLY